MAKRLKGKTFAVFADFYSIVNLFPQIMVLSIGNIAKSTGNAKVKVFQQITIFHSKCLSNVLPYMIQ